MVLIEILLTPSFFRYSLSEMDNEYNANIVKLERTNLVLSTLLLQYA